MLLYTILVTVVISILLFLPTWLAIIFGRITKFIYFGLGVIVVSLPFETSYLVASTIVTSIIALFNLYLTDKYIKAGRTMSYTPFVGRRSLLNYFIGIICGIVNNIIPLIF